MAHWLFVKDKYRADGNASLRTFLNRVIRNKLMDMVREKESEKRKPFFNGVSLDDISDEDGEPMHAKSVLMVFDEGFKRVSDDELPAIMARVVSELSFRQRQLCKILSEEGSNQKHASRLMNVPRSTLQEEIKRIREVFKKFGLEDYLA